MPRWCFPLERRVTFGFQRPTAAVEDQQQPISEDQAQAVGGKSTEEKVVEEEAQIEELFATFEKKIVQESEQLAEGSDGAEGQTPNETDGLEEQAPEWTDSGADGAQSLLSPPLRYGALETERNGKPIAESEPVLRVNVEGFTPEDFKDAKRYVDNFALKLKMSENAVTNEKQQGRVKRISLDDMIREDRLAAQLDFPSLPPFEEFMKTSNEQRNERVPVRRVVIGELTRGEKTAIKRQELQRSRETGMGGASASQNQRPLGHNGKPVERIQRTTLDVNGLTSNDTYHRIRHCRENSNRFREMEAKADATVSTIYEMSIADGKN